MDQEQSSTKSKQNTDQEQKGKSEQTSDQEQAAQSEQQSSNQKQTEQKTADQEQAKEPEQQEGEPKEADISLERVLELLKQANLINLDAPLRSLFKQGKIVTPTEWGLLMASGHWLLLWRRKGL